MANGRYMWLARACLSMVGRRWLRIERHRSSRASNAWLKTCYLLDFLDNVPRSLGLLRKYSRHARLSRQVAPPSSWAGISAPLLCNRCFPFFFFFGFVFFCRRTSFATELWPDGMSWKKMLWKRFLPKIGCSVKSVPIQGRHTRC